MISGVGTRLSSSGILKLRQAHSTNFVTSVGRNSKAWSLAGAMSPKALVSVLSGRQMPELGA